MTDIYDLHCHSNLSDGILSPEELVSRAKLQSVRTLALTDHDTLAGVQRAQAQAEREGIHLITGIEFSCQWGGRGIHIVGLNIDIHSDAMLHAVDHQARLRLWRAEKIAEKLEKNGVENALQGAMSIAEEEGGNQAGQVLGRPHFAKYMVKAGVVANINQAFKRYLGAGKPGDIKQVWPEIGDVTEWIRTAGGVAVLAHPAKYKMTRTKLRVLLDDFIDVGGQAMEIISGKQATNITKDMANLANNMKLHASCGSDFHVPGQHWQELGAFGSMARGVKPVWDLWQ
ncbi:PHP domain-containing protein [Teredinibacter sp. KSP-S5-2]|uniref:PHP domain-containing protein n=1 Tax=Teredinibacter sp. KSP-S5-2 TaxID=3034506 RepID=UPI0029349F0A|nr:PHP domain-containing protein [Teredinibacter sp. KSP-S5-2]WNO11015.1 PHP domain-containing protein [Teredinibacter sp. KSP-S5-2]